MKVIFGTAIALLITLNVSLVLADLSQTVSAGGLRGLPRWVAPFGRADAFWDKSMQYFTDSDFYEGIVLGIQADSSNTQSSCAVSYRTMYSSITNLASYGYNEFVTNFASSGTSVNAMLGYYPMVYRKYQETALTAFDFYR